MNRRTFLSMAALPAVHPLRLQRVPSRRTEVSIRGDAFYINGRPTYAGRSYNGKRVEGLLMNVRVVQGIFDDLNPETASRWVYPDTKKWDPERNANEFVAAMPEWQRHGVLAFTINLQGGSPGGGGSRGRGAGTGGGPSPSDAGGRGGDAQPAGVTTGAVTPNTPNGQPAAPVGAATDAPGRGRGPAGPMLENTAIDPDGNLRSAYMARLERILNRADELGMVAIVGYFYFGQDQRLKGEEAVKRGVLNATNWILDHGYTNVLVEINNECNIGYDHDILKPPRLPELFDLVRRQTRNGRRLLVSSSFGGTNSSSTGRENPDTPATSSVSKNADFLLIHGNGPYDADVIRRCIAGTRALAGDRKVPTLINEDPNFHFTEESNHLLASVGEYVSWGYYEQGQNNYQDGYQSPPVNWGINTDNKKQFFELVKKVTGV
jgi:hypothetical protein